MAVADPVSEADKEDGESLPEPTIREGLFRFWCRPLRPGF